jgi:NhaP-type Na+/H+ or K+/H+ antiporter
MWILGIVCWYVIGVIFSWLIRDIDVRDTDDIITLRALIGCLIMGVFGICMPIIWITFKIWDMSVWDTVIFRRKR